jgi:hypothetical protein
MSISYEAVMEATFGSLDWSDARHILQTSTDAMTMIDILKILRSSVAFVYTGLGYFILNTEDRPMRYKRDEFLEIAKTIKILCLSVDMEDVYLSDIISKHRRCLCYTHAKYYPGICTEEDCLNTFRGYKASITNDNNDSLDPLLLYIRDIMCNGLEEVYEYLLNWLSFIVQRPDKPFSAILMVDRSNVSGVFWRFFSEKILGRSNCRICTTIQAVTARFNEHIEDKRFILSEQCNTSSIREVSVLKNLITGRTVNIEKRTIDLKQASSSHCIALISNHENHDFITDGDWRFMVIECSSVKNDLLLDCPDHFCTYLIRRDISGFNPRDIPDTIIKRTIMDRNG